MCGIAGYIGKDSITNNSIESTLSLMKKRGPDTQKYNYVNSFEHNNSLKVLFLHSRLSIIDLESRADQPFKVGPCTIIFNGEIYNYLELREELEGLGAEFITASDTEVLLKAYLEWGKDCTKRFEGMWSFAIWDSRSSSLLLSRDRFAEKPLYYYKNDDGIYFASEVKALKSLSGKNFEMNHDHVLRYMTLGYKSLYKKSQTFFEGVSELPYASNMIINSNLESKTDRYWKPPSVNNIQNMTIEEAIEGSRYHLFESVRIRLRSDVPLAFCLSGGVDSASLASIAAKKFSCKVATFSIIETDERYNEYDNIMATVNDLGCEHFLINIPQSESIDRLKNLVRYHDAPVATTTYFVHSLLSDNISANGFRVAFSGTAADEIYTGYNDHFLLHLDEMKSHKDYAIYVRDWQKNIAKSIRNPFLSDPELYTKNPNFREHVFDNSPEFLSWLTPEAAKTFYGNFSEHKFCDSLLRSRMLNELFHEATPVILHEDDLNSMYNSIENRSPYLDSRLCEFMFTVPPEHLIKFGYGKYILRESVKGILNDQVRLDRQKKGFNASINSLFDLKSDQVRDEFLNEKNIIYEWIDHSKVAPLFDQDNLPNHYSKFIFSLINTQIFMEQN